MMRIIVATGNVGKVRELRELLTDDIEVVMATDEGLDLPDETGDTFEQNAALKALAVSRLRSGLVLADDSGLEVDALGGRPGVRSARFAGEPANDAANIALLLRELAEVPDTDRAARFVCALCLARDGAVVAEVRRLCDGRIAHIPRGDLGFGYDPVFLVADGRTMAQLAPAEKNVVSHRGSALRAMVPHIARAVSPPDGSWDMS